MSWFKKITKSLKKHSKRVLSKDYWTGRKGSYLGHVAFAGLGPIAAIPDSLHAYRTLSRGAKNRSRMTANLGKYGSGVKRHSSVIGGNTAQSVTPIQSSTIGGTGFHRYF